MVAPQQQPQSQGEDDMRFKLTREEHEAVSALKEACEIQNVKYRSIFELAKYSLVVKSQVDSTDPRAAMKRLELALKRLKKRRNWEEKHGMDQIDNLQALKEIDESAPGFFVVRYPKDCQGHNVVGHHFAYAPYKYIFEGKENLGKYFAAEQWRLDLAAADLEEARKGIAVVSIADGMWGVLGAYRYLRVLTKAKDNVNDMHPNRIRKVYSEIPTLGHHLVEAGKNMLPKKIASRIAIYHTLEDLEDHLCKQDEDDLKQQHPRNIIEWAKQRNAVYEESVQKVKL